MSLINLLKIGGLLHLLKNLFENMLFVLPDFSHPFL